MTTATTTKNLFGTTVKVPAAKKATDKKTIVAQILEEKVKRFLELKNIIDNATGELKMLEGDIKDVGKQNFLKEYRSNKLKPDNFNIEDKAGSKVMFICMDKYTIVDETKAEILSQFDELLGEKRIFTLNAELVDKYGEVLSSIIGNCAEISDEDKPNLITGELQYFVKKGSIDRLLQYDDMEQVFELINPICSLKK
jgi:hypothetical protein